MEEKIVDRFAFIDVAAGNIPSSQLHLIHTTTPFLNDHSLPPPPPPADDPPMLSSPAPETTIQPQPEPEPSPSPTTSNDQKNKGKLLVQEQEPPVSRGASQKRSEPEREPAPRAADDLLDAIRRIFGEPDPELGEMDILDVLAMKGIHFDNPPWHRTGGYDRKPKK